jgi:DNA-binding IscR family transcriptional regulator
MSETNEQDELDMMMEEEVDFPGLLMNLLASEEGETVGQSMSKIALALETQNKILIKIVSHLAKKP